MSNPNRRRRPVWCGDVDTTRPGAAWDVQDDGCCGPCKPPVPGCGPVRPPMPQFPDCGYHIPPVQYIPGMNEQEQLANLNCKMNELIELFNCNTDKVYGAYEEVVRSAVCNDAFYKEITVESGYLADASTSYELVHIPFVDCAGQPIYMEMGLAYNNTTNSGVTESVFDKALEVYADKILPAAERGFQGVAIWKGAPIYSGETHGDTRALIPGQCDYTLGVTENGYFKIYDTPKETDNSGMIKTMRQDKVRNSMGCAVIIRGGEYVVDGNLSEMELPCTVMAMNYKTKERFILAIGKDNVASDITPEMIANLLKKYDVDVAALTSWGQQSYLLDKGQFSFMPTSTDSDGITTVPQSAAFWYITKRRHFHNDYVKEVAALTIQMGENLWYDELTSEAVDNLKLDFVDLRNDLEQEIQDRKDADAALGERIDKEIAERKAADTALDEKYAAEVARLDGEIEALEQRVTDEVTRLDALIQSTKEALTAKDVKQVKVTHDGTRDTYQVVLNDGTVLGADMIVYNYDQLVQKLDSYATVEQRLNAEIQARKDADDALNALITAEQQARANGDSALAQQIESVRTELTELIQGNTTSITGLKTALDALTQTVQSNYTSLNERVTSNAGNIANLQGTYAALQATVAALNETVTGLQQSFASTEESFENVKQTVSNMQTELNAFEERIEGELGNYLPLSGGTLNGNLKLSGDNTSLIFRAGSSNFDNAIAKLLATGAINVLGWSNGNDESGVIHRGVGNPVEDTDAVNKKYVDTVGENLASEIAQVGGQLGNYLPLSGGHMKGSIALQGYWLANVGAVSFNYGSGGGENVVFLRSAPGRPTFNYPMYVFKGNMASANKEAGIEVNLIEIGDSVALAGVHSEQDPWGTDKYRLILFHGNGVEAGPVYVTNVATPITDDGAANKAYVDGIAETVVKVRNLTLDEGIIESVNNFVVNEELVTGFGVSNNSDGNGTNITKDGVQVVSAPSSRDYSLGTFGPNMFSITGHNSGYTSKVTDEGLFINYTPSNNDSVPRIYGRAVSSNQSILHAICFSEDGGFNPQDNFTRLIGIDNPVNAHDAATKGYVDEADEGFLYVDGGRLYAHGDSPQDVLLDRLDFAPGGLEAGGVVGLSCGTGTGGAVLKVTDKNSSLALLQAKTSDFSSKDDVMTVGGASRFGNATYGFSQPLKTTFEVTSADTINGAYMLRAPQGVWLINITGSQGSDFTHAESRLIGSTVDITVAVKDALTMTITFSQATNSISIAKVIGIEALTLEGVS